jgi:hypothetical protein
MKPALRLRSPLGVRLCFLLALGWIAAGVFPITPVEGDEMAVVNALFAWHHFPADFSNLRYLYEVQNGSYLLLHACGILLSDDYLTLFALLSASAAVLFVVAAGALLGLICDLPVVPVVLGLILCGQEFSAAAWYANTSTLGGVTAFAGLLCFHQATSRPGRLAAGLLLGVAGWLRMDALVVAPVVLALASGRWTERLYSTAETALVTVGTLLILNAWGGVSPADSWQVYSGKNVHIGYGPLFSALPLLLTFTGIVGTLAGLTWLIARQAGRLLGIFVLGVGPSIVLHGQSITTPKYLYYAAPFMLLPLAALVAHAVCERKTRRWPRVFLVAMALGLLGEWVFTVQTSPPGLRRLPVPTIIKVVSFQRPDHPWNLVVGCGEPFANDDGFRVRGGLLFSPWAWRWAKDQVDRCLVLVGITLDRSPRLRLIATSHNAYHALSSVLLRRGFRPEYFSPWHGDQQSGGTARFVAGARTCDLELVPPHVGDTEHFAQVINDQPAIPALLLNDRNSFGLTALAPLTFAWSQISGERAAIFEVFVRPQQ